MLRRTCPTTTIRTESISYSSRTKLSTSEPTVCGESYTRSLKPSSKIITSGTSWRTTLKSNLRNFAIVRSPNICYTTKTAKSLHVPLFLHKRWWRKECPIINTRCLAMRLKKIFGKLAGAKEKQTESSARAPKQEREKNKINKMKTLPDQGLPTTMFGKISVRKTIWDLEFSKHLL